jgi:mono/diheme cytochrome c family protein
MKRKYMKKTISVILIMLAAGAICITFQATLGATAVRGPLLTPDPKGKKIYEQSCLPCHQVDGSGVPGMNPPLLKSPYVQGSATALIGIILHGVNNGVEIEGESYSNPMPAFSTVLKDQEIADVLTYLRSHFGNKAGPISQALVSRIRQGMNK